MKKKTNFKTNPEGGSTLSVQQTKKFYFAMQQINRSRSVNLHALSFDSPPPPESVFFAILQQKFYFTVQQTNRSRSVSFEIF